jgi:hypothetical protein
MNMKYGHHCCDIFAFCVWAGGTACTEFICILPRYLYMFMEIKRGIYENFESFLLFLQFMKFPGLKSEF